VRESSGQLRGEKQRAVLAGEAGEPAPERFVRQFRGDVVVEDFVEPEAGDGEAAEAEHGAEDDDGGE
jgi:hypothetical protein